MMPLKEVVFPFTNVKGRTYPPVTIELVLEPVGKPPSRGAVDPNTLKIEPSGVLRVTKSQRGLLNDTGQIDPNVLPDDRVVFVCVVDDALLKRSDFNTFVSPTTGRRLLVKADSEDRKLKFIGAMLVRIAPRLEITLAPTPAVGNADGRSESIVKLTPQVSMD